MWFSLNFIKPSTHQFRHGRQVIYFVFQYCCIYICHTDNLPQVRKINLFFRPRLSMREPLAKSNKNSFLLLWTWSLKIRTFNLNRVMKMHNFFLWLNRAIRMHIIFFCDLQAQRWSVTTQPGCIPIFMKCIGKENCYRRFHEFFFENIFLFYILSFF